MDSSKNKINKLVIRAVRAFSSLCLRGFNFFKNFLTKKGNDSPFRDYNKQAELDKKLVFSLSKSRIPSFRQLKYIKRYLSRQELWFTCLSVAIFLASSIFLASRFYVNHLQLVPVSGGKYTEGLIGSPKNINPLYASISDADNDIASLVFSSLFKRGGKGELINDLAESHEVSQDGKSYTIKIRENVKWHNNDPLTIDDIVFTFNVIKDSQYKSPLRIGFSGVELERIDDKTIKFVLSEPYAAFLDLLTFGILPKNLWQQIAPNAASLAELNLKPIGSGPYKFKSLVKDKSGNIRSYVLVRNEDYYGDKAYLEELNFKFFVNSTELIFALNNNLIDGMSYLSAQEIKEVVAQDSLNIHRLNLPQLTAIFFNSKTEPVLADLKVRQALAYALDKNKIIEQSTEQNARRIDGPIFPDSFAYYPEIKKYNYNADEASKLLEEAELKIVKITEEDIAKAEEEAATDDEAIKQKAEKKILAGVGEWRAKKDEILVIKITTIDTSEYVKAAEEVVKFWEAVKVKTVVELIPASQIQVEVIRQRDFSVLLYSELVGADPDPYAFWHSSQAGQGGLNIANYANKKVDGLLEDARLTNDINIRKEKYKEFQEILAEEIPTIFLYSPTYTYVQAKKIKGFSASSILVPRDRFSGVTGWYIKTGKRLAL